ncbi:MAG: glycosyltransferase [Bryobacteraceae bacterium]
MPFERWPILLMARELAIGGSERQLCELVQGLDRSRFEPHVGCFRASGFRADELRAAGVPVLELPVRSFRSFSAAVGAIHLGRYIQQCRIALVHTFDYPLNLFGVPVARAFRAPVVVSSQRAHRALYSGLTRRLLRLTDTLVDAIVVNSLSVRRQLIAEDRVPQGRIQLCYNGIDLERFQPGPRCHPSALGSAAMVIGSVCALRPEKGLPTLVDAFAQLLPSRPGLRLLLVGDGPVRAQLEDQAARLGVRHACHFEPATADVPSWLHAIDIFVLPSLSEALSNSLMEAMACGCCAVVSCTGGNPELVQHERTGLLFPPGDTAGLAGCLDRLIADQGLGKSLAAAGTSFIRRNFSRQNSARRMAEIYASLIDRAAGGH